LRDYSRFGCNKNRQVPSVVEVWVCVLLVTLAHAVFEVRRAT
jgi:hypothetical protein